MTSSQSFAVNKFKKVYSMEKENGNKNMYKNYYYYYDYITLL